MSRWLRPLLACLAALLALPAYAEGNVVPKFALVIGNRDYPGRQESLSNTLRDADLIAQSLKKLGFAVTQRSNLDRSRMMAEVAGFAEQLPEGATALVYYAGHGMQVGGSSYLVPVDMVPTSEQTVAVKAYPLKTLLERLSSAKSAVNIVVLDACRNNPFQPRSAVRYRAFADLGLAPVQAPRGTLIAYSTAPGQQAADGKDANSLYTAALAKTILEPRLEIHEIFQQVAAQVRRRTLDDQIPWIDTSLTDKYYFLPPEGVAVVPGKPLQTADAGRFDHQPRRGLGPARPAAWFENIDDAEWNRIDAEIQQRVRQLTADEIPLLTHKAEGGNLMAQTTLGLAYRQGVDKTVDATGKVSRHNANNTRALTWLRRAADAGFPVAQAELGEMYYGGVGVDRDLGEARRWLDSAERTGYKRPKLAKLLLSSQPNPQRASYVPENAGIAYNAADLNEALLRNDLDALRRITSSGVKLTDRKVFAEWLGRKFKRETGELLVIQDAVDEDACPQYSASLSMSEGVPVYFEIKPGSEPFAFLRALKTCNRIIRLEAETFDLNLAYQRSMFGDDQAGQFRRNLKALAE